MSAGVGARPWSREASAVWGLALATQRGGVAGSLEQHERELRQRESETPGDSLHTLHTGGILQMFARLVRSWRRGAREGLGGGLLIKPRAHFSLFIAFFFFILFLATLSALFIHPLADDKPSRWL